MPIFGLIFVLPYWFIFKKAEFTLSLSTLMVVPVVNVATLYYVALSQWKTKATSA